MHRESVRPVDAQRRRLVTALPLLVCLGPGAASASSGLVRESRVLMGTRVEISVPACHAAPAATRAAWREMDRLVQMMSRYLPTSAVNAIQLAAGLQPVPVPGELMQVLQAAQRQARRTNGAFDVTIGALAAWRFDPRHPAMPTAQDIARGVSLVDHRGFRLDEAAGTAFLARRGMAIDLGGIAKLPILAAGLATLKQHGLQAAMINGGGDVVAAGALPGRPWRIGVRDPRDPAALIGVVTLDEGVVASSGDYERYFLHRGQRLHHVLDPATGRPTRGPRGVTLVARDLEVVNGWGASIMVMGAAAGRHHIERTTGLDGLIVDTDGSVWTSPGLKERLAAPRRITG